MWKNCKNTFFGSFLPIFGSFWDHFWSFSPKLEFCQTWNLSWKNNNNMLFPFKPFPDKNNDKIYEKNAKIPFLGHFCPFLGIFPRIRIFPKNWALSLLSSYGPLTSCKISRKSNEQFLRKRRYGRTDGRTDERTDGQPWNHRTLPQGGGPTMDPLKTYRFFYKWAE